MNDKELLLMAAKAAGAVGEYRSAYIEAYNRDVYGIAPRGAGSSAFWNPLTSDGDALRLAVKLKFDVMTRWGEAHSAVLDRDGVFTMQLDTDLDMCAATRRAIVRAAAEIGSKL